MEKNEEKRLRIAATKIRKNILEAVYTPGSGHPGGSLGCADILTILYFKYMNIDPQNPKMEDRDRFVLSKGHCAPALYSTLAQRGFFPTDHVKTFRSIDSNLQGHPEMKGVPGVDMSTGSLGQGISAANGMAIAGKIAGKNYHVYTVLGDGELEEGQVWEAAMFAAHYKLDNLTAFVDWNGLQIDGDIEKVMSPVPIAEKFRAFNWNVIEVDDAHDYNKLEAAIDAALTYKGKPTMIVCKSVKGKGVSYMEGKAEWHGAVPKEEQYIQAQKELDELLKSLEV